MPSDPAKILEARRPEDAPELAPVCVMENHDGAYFLWRERQVRRRILVHLDAHHDMWWIPERGRVTIANFVCQAVRDDLVRELYWVVPDPTWESARSRRPLLQQLDQLGRQYPGGRRPVRILDRRMETEIGATPVTVCPLDGLPRIWEPVLLDIDLDFLVIPRVSAKDWDRHSALPWCWPEELAARLRAAGVRSEVTTVVYSVEGGYTPLKWKYLGEELARRLDPRAADSDGTDRLRLAALAAARGEHPAAERYYREAMPLLPASAAPLFHLAHLCLEMGRREEARSFYQRALAVDPSYRTPYNSSGLCRDWDRRYRQAEREHRRTLELDPHDPYAQHGLGRLAARRKRWAEAEAWLRKSLEVHPELVDSYRVLGKVLERQSRLPEAIQAYSRALRLTLTGHQALSAAIATQPYRGPVADRAQWYFHGCLARLHEQTGDHRQALHGYRLAIAGGYDGVVIRARLARLHLRRGAWREGGRHVWQAVRRAPREIWIAARRSVFRLRRALVDR